MGAKCWNKSFSGNNPGLLVVFLTCLWPLFLSAQLDDPTITICNDCNSGFDYSQAAVGAAQFEFDGLHFGGSDDVYVVNITTIQTMAYRVTRTVIDPDPYFLGDETYQITATPIDGDPLLMIELADALKGIQDFSDAMVQAVPAEQLDLPFDSALDLIGVSNDFNRIRLQNALEDRFGTSFSQSAVHFNNMIRMVGGVFGAQSSFPPPGNGFVRVNFSDGTTVRARVETAPDVTESGFQLEFDVDVDIESIRSPDGEGIPHLPNHLTDFEISTPSSGFSQGLRELFQRLGAAIGPTTGDGSCETWSCGEVVTEDGPMSRCSKKLHSC